MYTPTRYRQTDLAKLHAFVEEHSFATLITHDEHGTEASHLPLLLDRSAGQFGSLVGHMARANKQWHNADGQSCMVIFNGPHAYISPNWYHDQTNVVPTWNYLAVHAHGTFHLDDSQARRLEIVRESVDFFESTMPTPWSMDRAEPDFIEKTAAMIVGFRIDIARLDGNWKLNQHHPAARRATVVEALRRAAGGDQQKIADLMEQSDTDAED